MRLPLAPSFSTILDADLPRGRASSLYIHVPFCFHKCHYCDFYSLVDDASRHDVFVDRLLLELEASRSYLKGPLKTIFVGGGTPSLLAPQLWGRVLDALNSRGNLVDREAIEFTIEANPETVTPELAETLRAGGVNRISIGCQSFDLRHLKTLERWHDPANVTKSVDILRRAGFDNLNLDLIFAIPGQTLADWLNDLRRVIEHQPEHISCYGLTFETNTPLYVKMKAGRVEPADEALEAEMYEATIETLRAAGYVQYEISNWSKPDRECRHNLVYWTNGNWWPLGPSASGHVDGVRWKNVPRIGDYLDRSPHPIVSDVERLDEDGVIGERFMVGLRLNRGMPLRDVEAMLGRSTSPRGEVIERFVGEGLLERTSTHLRLTHRGRLLANEVVGELI